MLYYSAATHYLVIQEVGRKPYADCKGRGNGLAVRRADFSEPGGSSPRLGSRRSSLISIQQAELLSRTPLLVLCCTCLASNHGIACALRLGPTQPVTNDLGMPKRVSLAASSSSSFYFRIQRQCFPHQQTTISHCMPGLPEGHASPTSWPPVLTILCQLAVQKKRKLNKMKVQIERP